MSVRTVFLARLLGLYCIIMAVAMVLQPNAFATIVHSFVDDAPLVLISGVFTLFAGLAIVLLHNDWSGGALPVIITLLGWLTLIKAVVLLVLPPARLSAFVWRSFPGLYPDFRRPHVTARVLSHRRRFPILH